MKLKTLNSVAHKNPATHTYTHSNGNHMPDKTHNYMLVWPKGTKRIKQTVE